MDELEFGDYDLQEDVVVVSQDDAIDYVDVEQDDLEGLGGPGNAPRTPEEAIDVARAMSKNRVYVGSGMCLKTVRTYYGVNAKYLSAEESYYAAEHKRQVKEGKDVPRGVAVYWTNGRYGHIALSIGGGLCYSTDWKEPGKIDVAYIDEITQRWGQTFRGYAWEVNDVITWTPNPAKPVVSLDNLTPGKKNEDVLEVKKALVKKGYKGINTKSKKYGFGIRRAYKKFQERLGYTGADANGIPGRKSLRKLGFKVKD